MCGFLFLLHQKGVVLCRNNRKTDTTCFFILIARCDPLHNYSHPSVGHLGRVSVQGTVKQIQADRYGNDSRRRVVFGRGGGIVKSLKRVSERNHGGGGGGVSVVQTTRNKGTLQQCRNKGAGRSLSFSFLSF